ncbi:hypothetical protein Agub_g8645 [Astrephomene gubernaculifera]|uniref:Pyridoxal phosphate homeostasis protein n=1 Tax=Astrephomene gubernaculifera TaxID=47775 RepID=A0AAD3DS18_9CHLO|nr:hypothetical protein Agub_g8645 [Astrephomene gubernaculifera]
MATALLLSSSRRVAVKAFARSASTMADKPVAVALQDVVSRMKLAAERAGRTQPVRLVAVSKTKPVEAVQEAYDAGQRVFGENYVQEMLDKAPQLPTDVQWHFIGHLQSNKVKSIVESVPNLSMVETVDSVKLADKLNRAVEQAGRQEPLAVMVQVNTSGEESKHGVEPEDCVELARHIAQNCGKLRLAGLMTIGMPDYSSRPENFSCLAECRTRVAAALGLASPEQLELSMGMSGDFEQAIEMGSTNIRVGSTIFGAREYPSKAPKSPSPPPS